MQQPQLQPMQPQSQIQQQPQQTVTPNMSIGSSADPNASMNVTTSMPTMNHAISVSQMQQGVSTSSVVQTSMMQQPQQTSHPIMMQSQQIQHQQQQQIQQQQQMQQQQQIQPQQQSMGNEQNATTSMPINVATISVSQPQQMQALQPNVNTSSGAPVQMQQLAPQPQTLQAGTMMSQSSQPHPTMMHPTMTMAQAPLQQVQVIQQPLSASYLQHLYSPQQQMLFPNLTLQHTGMGTQLQSIGGQGLSLQLQAKTTLDAKTSVGQNMQAVNAGNKPGMVNASTMGQVISAGPKGNFQQQMMAGPAKSAIIHSQSGFASNNPNQTVVIGQLGMLPNHFGHKTLTEYQPQKGKTYTALQAFHNQPTALQPKSSIFPSSTLPVHSSAQVFNGSHLKQISSQPQIITSQAGTMLNQAQLLGLQALGSLPPGLSFATPGCLQSTTLLGQNPIIIRSSQQSDMFIQQSQPQASMHLPVAAQPMPPTSYATTAMSAPKQQKQVKVRPGIQTQTVAVATQTNVSSSATVNANTAPVRTQIRPKKILLPTGSSPSPAQPLPQMATTQTQTQQPQIPHPHLHVQHQQQHQQQLHQKSDAGNQTYPSQPRPVLETKSSGTQSNSKSVETSTKLPSSPLKSQGTVAPSAKVVATATTTAASVTTVTTSTSTIAKEPAPTAVVETKSCETQSEPALPQVAPPPVPPANPPSDSPAMVAPAENEHLKPQQPILKPSLGIMKDKQPQKAIVKPQVLTHVIDGFVIQEGPEPFPVSRSALLDSPCRVVPTDKADSNQKRKDSPTVDSPDKKMKAHRARGNVELAKCEFCGKLGPKSKFKRSKRFCSNSCAKKFQKFCNSKGTGLLPSAIQDHVAAGPGRKKKVFRGRKSLKKLMDDGSMDTSQADENTSAQDDESSVSNKTEEESSDQPADSPQPMNAEGNKDDIETIKTDLQVSKKLPNKWTVQEVYEFIRDLPGCSDYADIFKSQEIDGQALLLLKEDHLMTAMSMKLGPALKLMSQIRSMREEVGPS